MKESKGQTEMNERTSEPLRAVCFVAAGLFIPLAGQVVASDMGDAAAAMVSEASYRHFMDDVLYTHTGDDRGYGPEHNLARANIVTLFESYGLATTLECGYFSGRYYCNVVGTKLGTTYPDQEYILGAHYDSVGNPGADDNASGVALMLETARVLRAFESEYTIRFIAFDREETPPLYIYGSRAYVAAHSGDDIRGMICADMVAWDRGVNFINVICEADSPGLQNDLMQSTALYGNGLDYTPLHDGRSDYEPFHWAGYPACLVIEQWGPNPYLHHPLDTVDTPDYIDYGFATRVTRSVVGYLVDHAGVNVTFPDCNENGIDDPCDLDCGALGGWCDVAGCGESADDNDNGIPDECDPPIPTVSEWGLAVMTLLILATGTLVLRKQSAWCGAGVSAHRPARRRNAVRIVAAVAIVLGCVSGAQAVDMETVSVTNPGNAGELSGEGVPGGFGPNRICGAVDHVYNIAKFEVTAGQYVEFLNAVAGEDTYGLYNVYMWLSEFGCKIERAGTSPNYTYSVTAEWANRPVNYVSWGDAARFANWLHNGQPTGAQDLTTTEDGSYFLNGATSAAQLLAITREPDATWVIPSEDEWYKAAYHRNDGATGNYWNYPTQSNTPPTGEAPPGTDMTNGSANAPLTAYVDRIHYRTEVGAYDAKPSDSAYGTFDQGGNLWELNEAVILSGRGARGGWANVCSTADLLMNASIRGYTILSTDEYIYLGFRVAEIP